ncbi:SDR family NAD(P)-dependent oxidoreductase [Sinirhodobacter huangdaonensis]|uniref:SDR family NAD(P)-dependent oxidoreductase n=1 Tax=Paenirhodobacter huangdaonensis TaxID=2501515 RepID=A0A443LFS2_9RHOB|nr:SDR family NAD(P)-dependent oxidoreductase [Sinirhodobacter huangdaonensis]
MLVTTVLIAGTSSGYGLETARHFHARGWTITATMRTLRDGLLPEGVRLLPLAAAYTASKQAIEGFTGSQAHELGAFGVRAKLVEPGYAPTTRFSQNIDFTIKDMIPPAYADFAAPIFAAFANPSMTTTESDVAEAVFLAATDGADRLHYPAGPDAVALAAI